jgi:uncharacterized protein YkwD
MKRRFLLFSAVVLTFWILSFFQKTPAPVSASPALGDPYTLIALVNNLRAANGLPPYAVNSILMQVAQAHSEYQASIGTVTHYSADGSRPFQRALAAGYPVAGDLSLGGFYSENIAGGTNLSPEEAVQWWQGDAPHLHTMLSSDLTEVGAGVASDGNFIYYTLDAARPLGSGSVSYTPPSGATSPPVTYIPPVVANTPAADGSVHHIVQAGQSLWTIAAVYETTVDALRELNGLSPDDFLHPGDDLLIRPPYTPTPSETPSPTRDSVSTATSSVTPSPRPAATETPLPTSTPDTPAKNSNAPTVAGIILLALLVAAAATWLSLQDAGRFEE